MEISNDLSTPILSSTGAISLLVMAAVGMKMDIIGLPEEWTMSLMYLVTVWELQRWRVLWLHMDP